LEGARVRGVSEACVQKPVRSGFPSAAFGTCAMAGDAMIATASATSAGFNIRITILLWVAGRHDGTLVLEEL